MGNMFLFLALWGGEVGGGGWGLEEVSRTCVVCAQNTDMRTECLKITVMTRKQTSLKSVQSQCGSERASENPESRRTEESQSGLHR